MWYGVDLGKVAYLGKLAEGVVYVPVQGTRALSRGLHREVVHGRDAGSGHVWSLRGCTCGRMFTW